MLLVSFGSRTDAAEEDEGRSCGESRWIGIAERVGLVSGSDGFVEDEGGAGEESVVMGRESGEKGGTTVIAVWPLLMLVVSDATESARVLPGRAVDVVFSSGRSWRDAVFGALRSVLRDSDGRSAAPMNGELRMDMV